VGRKDEQVVLKFAIMRDTKSDPEPFAAFIRRES